MYTNAITRKPGENFAEGLTTSHLGAPDYQKMLQQHQAYVDTLKSLGLQVLVLDSLPDHPDAYFVEDVAVVTPQVAVVTNPGADSRRGEAHLIKDVLSKFRNLQFIQPPGTLDGGDVLQVKEHFFIGISERSNQEGAEQLGVILEEHGYTWTAVPIISGLHLKSSLNYVGVNTLLVTSAFQQLDFFAQTFSGYETIILDDSEIGAANTMLVNERLIMPVGFPGAREKLVKLGYPLIELDMSEARKMDGGLTCMSLRF